MPADGTTRVTIHSGTGAVYGEGGHALPLGGGQQITFRGPLAGPGRRRRSRRPRTPSTAGPPSATAARTSRSRPAMCRARWWATSSSMRTASGSRTPTHGAVWFPQGTPRQLGALPPRPLGMDLALGLDLDRRRALGLCAVPLRPLGPDRFALGLGARPAGPAPDLRAGTGGLRRRRRRRRSHQRSQAVPAWPGSRWRPAKCGSPAFAPARPTSATSIATWCPAQSDATYAYQRRPEALTAISGDDFHRGRPVGAGWLRVAANTLTNAADRAAAADARAHRRGRA